MAYPRFLRVKNLLQRELSDIVRAELKDPRLGAVTITRVDLTPDCKFATVYFSPLGQPAGKTETLAGLESATGYIRSLLRKRLDLRYIPEVQFKYDRNIDYSFKISKKIDELKIRDVKNGRDTGSR